MFVAASKAPYYELVSNASSLRDFHRWPKLSDFVVVIFKKLGAQSIRQKINVEQLRAVRHKSANKANLFSFPVFKTVTYNIHKASHSHDLCQEGVGFFSVEDALCNASFKGSSAHRQREDAVALIVDVQADGDAIHSALGK
jgi:hypothetical protein